jgi:hypothetical protein
VLWKQGFQYTFIFSLIIVRISDIQQIIKAWTVSFGWNEIKINLHLHFMISKLYKMSFNYFHSCFHPQIPGKYSGYMFHHFYFRIDSIFNKPLSNKIEDIFANEK